MSNNDKSKVKTLHPDEHVSIIMEKVENSITCCNILINEGVYSKRGIHMAITTDIRDNLVEQIDELDSLRSYLRTLRRGGI